jgi:hypothetical protein
MAAAATAIETSNPAAGPTAGRTPGIDFNRASDALFADGFETPRLTPPAAPAR